MQTTPDPLAALVQAVAFAADKHRNQRRKDAEANWSPERKQAYFDWAANVVAGLRGVHPGLEAVFDGLYARTGDNFRTRSNTIKPCSK